MNMHRKSSRNINLGHIDDYYYKENDKYGHQITIKVDTKHRIISVTGYVLRDGLTHSAPTPQALYAAAKRYAPKGTVSVSRYSTGGSENSVQSLYSYL